MDFNLMNQKFDVDLCLSRYVTNDRLYVGMMRDGIPFGDVTVNVDDPSLESLIGPYDAFLDTNNMTGAVCDFVEKNELAEPTGLFGMSGYCIYPLYHFDKEKLKEMYPKAFEEIAVDEAPKKSRGDCVIPISGEDGTSDDYTFE